LRLRCLVSVAFVAPRKIGYTLSKNISKKGPQNRRSLGFARDDKKGRVVVRKGRLLMKKASRPTSGLL
jgi:hypothetical protein